MHMLTFDLDTNNLMIFEHLKGQTHFVSTSHMTESVVTTVAAVNLLSTHNTRDTLICGVIVTFSNRVGAVDLSQSQVTVQIALPFYLRCLLVVQAHHIRGVSAHRMSSVLRGPALGAVLRPHLNVHRASVTCVALGTCEVVVEVVVGGESDWYETASVCVVVEWV